MANVRFVVVLWSNIDVCLHVLSCFGMAAFYNCPLMVCHLTEGRKAWWELCGEKEGPDEQPG